MAVGIDGQHGVALDHLARRGVRPGIPQPRQRPGFLDAAARGQWALRIKGGIKPELDTVSQETLAGFVTLFDEAARIDDINAELDVAAREWSALQDFDSADTGAGSPRSVPCFLYSDVAGNASAAARNVMLEFAAAKRAANLDTMSDPWILGYICSAIEWGLLGLGDSPTDDDCLGREERYCHAFMEVLVNDIQSAIDLLRKIEAFKTDGDSRFDSGRAAYRGVPSGDTFAIEEMILSNYLNGVFICSVCGSERKQTEADSDTCELCGARPAGLFSPAPGDRVEIEGARVASWGVNAPRGDLDVLVNAEYSDADAEYVLQEVDNVGIAMSSGDHGQTLRKSWPFFSNGTFFLDHVRGSSLLRRIEDALSPSEREILNAREYLRRHGIITAELGGDLVVRKIFHVLQGWDERKDVPAGADWQYVIDVFRDGSSQLRAKGTSLVRGWVAHVEGGTGSAEGRIDAYRRIGLATLYRHSGQFEKALAVSDFVEFPMNRLQDQGSVAVLCTTRAATFMDLAEHKPQERAQLLKSARLTLNKAHAISGGDSDYVMKAYVRLKRLETEASAERQREIEAMAWRKIKELPPD